MRKIRVNLDIGFAGCGHEDIIEVPENMTPAEIDEMVHDMAMDWAQSWEGDERLGWGHEDEDQEEVTEQFYEGVGGTWEDTDDEEV